MLKKSKLQWLFNRLIALFFISLLGLMMVAVVINMFGIRITSSIESWQRYLTENAANF